MRSRLQPVAIKQWVAGIGGGDDDIHPLHHRFCGGRWFDWNAELLAHRGAKRLATLGVPAEGFDRLNPTDRADRLKLRACLPTGAEYPHTVRLSACHIFGRDTTGRSGSHLS